MNLLLVMMALQQLQQPDSARLWQQVMESLDRSGRVVEIVHETTQLEPPRVAPGAPPLLSFRFFEGRQRHRFGDLGLVMDDAGH